MCRRLNLLTAVVLVLAMAGVVPADESTWKGTVDSSWYNAGNWSGGVPEPNDQVEIPYVATNIPIIVDWFEGIDVNVGFGGGRQFKGPAYDSDSDMSMEIQSGTFYLNGGWRIQDGGSGIGTVTISGGDVTINGGITGCNNEGEYCIINFTGGQFTSTGSIRLADNDNGGGQLRISGDPNIEIGGLSLETGDDQDILFSMTGGNLIIHGSFSIGGDEDSNVTAYVDGGRIVCDGWGGDDNYTMDIHDVNFRIYGDHKLDIQEDIDDGNITGYDNTRTPSVVYWQPWTVLGFDLYQFDAWNPKPTPGTGNLCSDPCTLSWIRGDFAVDHNIYFGSSMDDVNESATAIEEHVDVNYWTTPELSVGTSYYWRIETVNDACASAPWPGNIWSIGTHSGVVKDGWPDTRGLPVAAVTELYWTPSCFADTHKVYFAEDLPENILLFEDDFSDGSFDPNWVATGAWDVWYPNDPNLGPHDHNLARVTGAGTLEMNTSVDATDACSIYLEFKIRRTVEITDGMLKLYYWNGSSYDEIADLNSTPSGANDVWLGYGDTITTDDPYLINDFKIKIVSTISAGEVYIDDVKITDTWPAAAQWYDGREDGNTHAVAVESPKVYHWRVDTIAGGKTIKGPYWTFSIGRKTTLMWYSFNGTPGGDFPDYPTAIPDNTGNVEFYKYVGGIGSVKYGESNPFYERSGTSAAIDPCAGLYRRDPCDPDGQNPDILRLDGYQYTIEMWIRPEALIEDREDQYLIGKSGANTWSIYINDPGDCGGCNNDIRWEHSGGGFDIDIEEEYLDWDNPEWLHLAVVLDMSQPDPDNQRRFFFFGEEVDNGDSWALNAPDNNAPVAIGFSVPADGNVANGGEYFQGLIDEIRIMDIALDPGHFLLTPGPEWASNPRPRHRAIDIDANDPNFLLSWMPGSAADTHKVYFGTDFYDVNTSAAGTYVGEYPYETNETNDVSLVFGQNHYWRVDEVNENVWAPAGSPWKGIVWKFTTLFLIEDEDQLLRYRFDEDGGLTATDSSGHGKHGTVELEGMNFADWGPAEGKLDGCLKFDDDTIVDVPDDTLDLITDKISISVWLYGVDRGLDPGDNWVLQAGDDDYYVEIQVPDANGNVYWRAGNDTNDVLTWEAGAATVIAWRDNWHHLVFIKDEADDKMSIYFDGELKWWKEDTADSNLVNILGDDFEFRVGDETDGDGGYEGWMDDLRVYKRALTETQILRLFRGGDLDVAWGPSPYDDQTDASYDTHLTWKPGDDANSHKVFFGRSEQQVANMIDPCAVKELGDEDYDPGLLELDTYYHWRIDEVNEDEGNTWPGPVWRFKVAKYVTIDDFESYHSQNQIKDTWRDYWWQAQNPPYTVTGGVLDLGVHPYDVVYPAAGGTQSMLYMYTNILYGYPVPPGWPPAYASVCYSEVLLPMPAELQDWTVGDVRVLRLFFYGNVDNDVNAPLYVGVRDGSGPSKYAEVRYGEYDPNNEDVNDVNEPEWHRWDIGLPHFKDSNFASVVNDVDLSNIAELYIGFGDRRNPVCGGLGVVIFDDIRLHMAICRPEFGPLADFSGNCIVDMADVGIMAGAWLRHDVNYSPGQMQEPNDANLVGWWRLDGDTNDSSIWDHNSTIEGSYSWVTGHNDVNVDDLALEFGADGNSRVLVEDDDTTPELRPEHQVSASAWVYFTKSQNDSRVVVKGQNDEETYEIEIDDIDLFVFTVSDVNGNQYSVPDDDDDKNIWTDDWIHLAGTYDGNTVKSYVNGELFGSTDANFVVAKGWTLSQDTTGLAIGGRPDSLDDQFEGTIDEVRVYDYALSQAEVAWLATDGTGYVPLTSPYDLYDKEAPGKRAINYRDFAMLLEDWLEEILYP